MLSRRLEDTLISGTVIEEKYLKESQHGWSTYTELGTGVISSIINISSKVQ